ncbi:YxeA family protein [Enterococcus crotali]|uniref:YxeA family protein n=1 Tax=Enterococcus crotali TaxID=1453587 RepID=UPI000472078C|nr:YxeA family protein [Enterococcus crotali]
MKHFCKFVLAIIIIIIASMIGLRMYTYKNTSTTAAMIDYFNPLVKTATLYTKTTEKYEYKYPDAVSKIENFAYVETSYTAQGEKRKVEYISFGKKLQPGKFLKLTTKGQNVMKWEEIDKQELPEKVKPLLF